MDPAQNNAHYLLYKSLSTGAPLWVYQILYRNTTALQTIAKLFKAYRIWCNDVDR